VPKGGYKNSDSLSETGTVPDKVEEGDSPSQSYSRRFPADQLFRKQGYRIERRPDKGPAVWSKNGVLFTQDDLMLRYFAKEQP
jgi:hypothetical protein